MEPESLQVRFNGTDVNLKTYNNELKKKKTNINLMILIFTFKCWIYSEYKEFIQDISESTGVPD